MLVVAIPKPISLRLNILSLQYLIIFCRQYFVVMFKDKPFELWDLRSASLIRQMPRNFPQVTALVTNVI